MEQDSVNTYAVPFPIDREHGPQRGGRRRVIEETSLCRKRVRETLQRQLDLAHVHAELNGEKIRMRIRNGTLL